MSSKIVFIDTYSCPHCRAELETGMRNWQGWQRCPTCGVPSLPPEPARFRGEGRRGDGTIDDEVLVIADLPEMVTAAEPMALIGPPAHVSGARLVLRTGLFVSAGLAFIFFLDRRTTNAVIFASLSFAFLLALVRKTASRKTAS